MSQKGRQKGRDHDLVGQVVAGKYRVVRLLGQGGFGSVFLVEMVGGILGAKLAMKILPREFGDDPALREQFLHEIRVAMKMVSRYIVQIRDVGTTEDGLLYYTMDHVPGRTLGDILREEKVLPPQQAVRIAMRLLKALTTAHSAGVIHRDLKPANIMVDTAGGKDAVRVLDFGIATAIGQETKRQKGFAGSPHYMPPEQFLGTEMGFYTDLYSVGVILYECLAGQKPYSGTTPQQIYDNLKRGPPRPIGELAPEVADTGGLAGVVMRAIERNPEKRYQSAREFFEALAAATRGAGTAPDPGDENEAGVEARVAPGDGRAAREAPAPRRAAGPRVRRRRRLRRRASIAPAIAVILFVALAGGGLWRLMREHGQESSEAGPAAEARGETDPVPSGDAGPGERSPEAEPSPQDDRAGDATAPRASVDGDASPEGNAGPEEATGTPGAGPSPSGGSGGEEEALAPAEGAGTARPAEAFVDEARAAAAEEDWETVRDLTDEALHRDPKHPGALRLSGEAFYGQGHYDRAIEVLGDLRDLPGHGDEPAIRLLIARAALRHAPPRWDLAREHLEAVRAERPGDARVAALLARVLEHLGLEEALRELVIEAHEDGLRHEGLDRLYRELVVEPAQRRQEDFRENASTALEAWRDRRWNEAVEAAVEATGLGDSACMEWVLADAWTRIGRFDRARAAAERLAALGRSERGAPTDTERAALDGLEHRIDCAAAIERDGAERWASLLLGKCAVLRYEAGGRKDGGLLARAENRLREVLPDTDPGEPFGAIVRSWLALTLAYGEEEADPEAIERLCAPTRDVELYEVYVLQARAYFITGQRLDVDDHATRRKREQEIVALQQRVQRLQKDLGEIEDEDDREDAIEDLEEAAEQLRGLVAEHRAEEERRKLQRRAFDLATGRLGSLLGLDDLPSTSRSRGYLLLARIFISEGKVSDDPATLGKATNRFRRAHEAGLDSAEFHEEWGACYEQRDLPSKAAQQYKKAFDQEPTVERCLRTAEAYENANNEVQARKILREGLRRLDSPRENRDFQAALDRLDVVPDR